jgi:hypothetical protein
MKELCNLTRSSYRGRTAHSARRIHDEPNAGGARVEVGSGRTSEQRWVRGCPRGAWAWTRVAAPAEISSTRTRVHPTGERSPRRPCTAGDAEGRHPRRAERAGGAEKPRAEARAYPGPEVRVRAACAMTDAGGAHANTHRLRPNRQAGGGQVECRACRASGVGASGGQ